MYHTPPLAFRSILLYYVRRVGGCKVKHVFAIQSGSFQDFRSPSKLSIQVGVLGRYVPYRNHAKGFSSSKFVLMETDLWGGEGKSTGLHLVIQPQVVRLIRGVQY